MIYTPDQTAAILKAIMAVLESNNGYADIGTDVLVAEALEAAGYTVIRSKDLHGKLVFKAFTAASQAALAIDGVSTYKAFKQSVHTDVEGLILFHQENKGLSKELA